MGEEDDFLIGAEKDDAKLQTEPALLQRPATFEDQELGAFTFDRRVECFYGSVDWRGVPIKLQLDAVSKEAADGLLVSAKALVRDSASWSARIQKFAVENCCRLRTNPGWKTSSPN